MRNAAYSPQYLAYLRDLQERLVCDEYKEGQDFRMLGDGLQLEITRYARPHSDNQVDRADACRLLSANGDLLYTYHAFNGAGLSSIFRHSNGKQYFIFQRDLYGYSALDMETLWDYHYIPQASACYGQRGAFEETFIWTGLHYNAENSVLAVDGCYWAAPYGILLTDFSDPMQARPWFILQDEPPFKDELPTIDFVKWDDTALHLAYFDDQDQPQAYVLTQNDYLPHLAGNLPE